MSHVVTISPSPWPGHEIPYLFAATCECGFTTGGNAFKWVALSVQGHYRDTGLIGQTAPGSLRDESGVGQ